MSTDPGFTSCDDLLTAPTPFDGDVLDPQIEHLPLHQLRWENFQKLCAQLIQHHYEHITQTFEYGRSGQAQEGIDVTWRLPLSSKRHVAQVKRWKKIGAADIENWVREFCEGALADDTEMYLLCLSNDLLDTQLVEAWGRAQRVLEAREVRSEIWHKEHIETLLRHAPDLVRTFFSQAIMERFCHLPSMPEPQPHTYRAHFNEVGDTFVTLENTSVRFELCVPTPNNLKPSAILTFGRSDLNGIILGLNGEELVSWLQWAGHYRKGDKVPFSHPSHTRPQAFVLNARQARLILEARELEELIWVLQHAWEPYRNAVEALDRNWQILRFKRLERDADGVYGLYSLSKPLWRLIIDYVRAHDYSQGDSPEHIFENPGNGVLKVFVPTRTAELDPGFHLITYVYLEGGLTAGLHEENLTLGWSPARIGGGTPHWSPRKQWDAEFTHHWFAHVLIPRVLRWYESQEFQRLSWLNKVRQTLSGSVPRYQLENHFYSSARLQCRALEETLTREQTIACLRQMQSHFYVDNREAAIEPALVVAVLTCIAELAQALPECHYSYVKSNLSLGQSPLMEGIDRLLAKPSKLNTATWLEMALRSLICCCETSDSLTDAQYRWLRHHLEPLWGRMREDLLCDQFR
ncbi:hypothetical protein [Pseudomonas purpurea]|uniref:hypothetical protein n=1 Tax=Pseudomonas purpurea TaxID=3136737 RepID=UPI003262F016